MADHIHPPYPDHGAPSLDHVLVATRDVGRSRAFYRDILELRELPRPDFKFPGAWFQLSGRQSLHLAVHEKATMRGDKAIDAVDVHFALNMASYEKTLTWLKSKGFSEDHPSDHPHKMVLRPDSIVGRPQIYIMDPDRNVIEFICDARA